MSTADDAERDGVLTNGTREPYERGYADGRRAGYRRALEDAADEFDSRADRDWDAMGARANVAIVCRDHAAELRAIAKRVGTKDGADDE